MLKANANATANCAAMLRRPARALALQMQCGGPQYGWHEGRARNHSQKWPAEQQRACPVTVTGLTGSKQDVRDRYQAHSRALSGDRNA